MAGKPKFTKAQVLQAIKGSAGIKVVICERLKCTRQTLENYIDRDPSIGEAVTNEREQRLDLAELIIVTNLQVLRQQQMATQGLVDAADAWKVLDKLGRSRGYGEKLSVIDEDAADVLNEDEIIRRIAAVMTAKAKRKQK